MGDLPLPIFELAEVSLFAILLEYPPVKALLPLPLLLVIAPALYWFFGSTWRELERERKPASPIPSRRAALGRRFAPRFSQRRLLGRARSRLGRAVSAPSKVAASVIDYRPVVCLLLVAVILTLHEYYGGRTFYETSIRPLLDELVASPEGPRFPLDKYDNLLGYGWWVLARVLGYLAPLPLWKLLFPGDSLLDMGLRTAGFLKHLWIYALCLGIVVAAMAVLATQPEFLNYYPFYKLSSRSWFDFLTWQAMYWVQFFALELFFRGWMLAALRPTFGVGAIFVMVVPYCMIHYGKPYLEAHAAIVAGVVLGSLAMRTRSIYAGFLVHVTVALLMDVLALTSRDAMPRVFWPAGG